jgi:hypothetical protein
MARKSSAIINQPEPNWVSLWEAPFYCFSSDYIHSAPEWADALQTEVRKITESDVWADALQSAISDILEAEQYSVRLDREWSFERAEKRPCASIIATGIRTQIDPPMVVVASEDVDISDPRDSPGRFLIFGSSEEELLSERWEEDCFLSLDEKIAAQWHRCLLKQLFASWKSSFNRALYRGAAHIMARKHSVLAPFERITFKQWQYFRLERKRQPQKDEWGNPRLFYLPDAAFGPTDERLYEIHIAPGVNRPKSDARNRSPEESCLEWLAELIDRYPDRPPKPRDTLAQEALPKFPGLTQNGFYRCFTLVQVHAQNHSWSKPGRPKSAQKLLQQK